jgi:ribonuclease T2
MIAFLSALRLIVIVTVVGSTFTRAQQKHLSIPNTFPNLTRCLTEPLTFSCENTTAIHNTCCSPTPGGLVLQTQFWDTWTGFEKKGQLLPKGSWTIHGLWPDNCDGRVDIIVIIRVF